MRMDENINPAWKKQCKGSSSGRKALQEIERLTTELRETVTTKYHDELMHDWQVIVVSKGKEIERLESALRGVLACCQEPHGLGDPGRLCAINTIAREALADKQPVDAINEPEIRCDKLKELYGIKPVDAIDDKVCEWTEDEDGWHGSCGKWWEFTDGGPKENGVKFCMSCGRPVQPTSRPDD